MRDRVEDELGEVGRPTAADRLDRFAHLDRVADGAAERLVHVGQHADDSRPARAPSSIIASASIRASSSVFMNAPSPTLTSSTIASAPAGDLLRHDARGDQRDVVDRGGHVAKRVEELVGRDEVRGLPDDRQPDLAHLRDELVRRQLDAEAGDRLELVERPAGVAEPAAAHLPERHAARGDDRPDRDRRLVPHAAGRVLVDDLAAERGAEVERLAAPIIASVSAKVSARVRPTEVHRHQERRHLVVGDLAVRVAEHELGQLLGRELAAVALALDQLGRPDHAVSATKTVGARADASGPSRAGSSSAIANAGSTRRRTGAAASIREGESPSRVAPLDPGEAPRRRPRRSRRGRGGHGALGPSSSQSSAQVSGAVRDGDEPAAGPQHARDLRERAVDVGHVVEHPRRESARRTRRPRRQRLDVADACVDPAPRVSSTIRADWSTATTSRRARARSAPPARPAHSRPRGRAVAAPLRPPRTRADADPARCDR